MTASRGIRVRRGTRLQWLEAEQGRHVCGCGCGSVIPLKAEHFNIGIPKYLHGHNTRVNSWNKKPKPEPQPCQCGCGSLASPGARFVSGHNSRGRVQSVEARAKIAAARKGVLNPQFGKRPPNFIGRQRHAAGYVLVHAPAHPFARNRNVMEHRLVLEAHLREADPSSPFLIEVDGVLYLSPSIEVHHINGVKDDNRLENLQPLTKAEHARLHQHLRS